MAESTRLFVPLAPFTPVGEDLLLERAGWPKLRAQDFGQISWTLADEDFNATLGSIFRDGERVSISLTRQGIETGAQTLLRAEFTPAPSPATARLWAPASPAVSDGAPISADDAIELFRHWVDGQASLPKFIPIGRAPSLSAENGSETKPAHREANASPARFTMRR